MRLSLLLIIIIMCVTSGCVHYIRYIPAPEKDVEDWIINFSQQRSFDYHYRLKSANAVTEASGECIIGLGEHIQGRWFSEDTVITFEYIGLKDIEYKKQGRIWVKSARGEESDLFTQIMRLFEFDKFYYLGEDETYNYQFWANIPFLAPGRWKEMVGFLNISKRNFLPVMIWTGLKDSSVYFHIEVSNYNKHKTIKSPVKNNVQYLLNLAPEYKKAVSRRLKLIGVDFRLREKNNGLYLSIPDYYSSDDLALMFSKSVLKIYQVVDEKTQAERVGYLKNDTKLPLFLGSEVLTNKDIKDIKIKFSGSSKPYFEIKFKGKFQCPPKLAFELNDEIINTVTLDIDKKIDKMELYTDMPFLKMRIIKASLLQPLPEIAVKPVAGESS